MGHHSDLNRTKYYFDDERVKKLIIKIKTTTNDYTRDACMVELYLRCSFLILKNVNSMIRILIYTHGFKLNEIYDKMTLDDFCSESYIILKNCVAKFDRKHPDSNFQWYLNKSLGRGLHRMIKFEFVKNRQLYIAPSQKIDLNRFEGSANSEPDSGLYEMYFKNFGLTRLEKMLATHRLNGQTISDFCSENNIPTAQYYRLLNSVKLKMEELLEDE